MSVRFVIDSLDFVRNAGIHHGKIPLVELLRLHDFLFDSEGELIYQVCGRFDQDGKPGLYLEISGRLHLRCQRCLDKLTRTINLQTFLLLVEKEAELDLVDEDDTVDAILATSELDVLDLIEDEIILSLSISSCHPEGECSIHNLASNEDNFIGKTQATHPFAALAALKNKN